MFSFIIFISLAFCVHSRRPSQAHIPLTDSYFCMIITMFNALNTFYFFYFFSIPFRMWTSNFLFCILHLLKFFHLNISHFYLTLFFIASGSCFNGAHCSRILLSKAKSFRMFSWFLQDITCRNIFFLWAFKLVILFPYSMVFHCCCYILFCFFLLFTNYQMGALCKLCWVS